MSLHAFTREIFSNAAAFFDANRESRTSYAFGDILIDLHSVTPDRTGHLFQSIQARRAFEGLGATTIHVLAGDRPELAPLLPARHRDRTLFYDGSLYYWWTSDGAGTLMLVDLTERVGLAWYRIPEKAPSWQLARPLLPIIKALSLGSRWTPIHGAVIANERGGILIAGKGGAGKSTMALACVHAGWRYVGDDFVLVTADPPRAANLYSSARLRYDMFHRFSKIGPAIVSLSVDSGELKAEIDVSRLADARIGDAAITAIVVPRRNGALHPSSRRIGPLEGLRALLPSTLISLPGGDQETFNKVGQLVANIPCFAIDPGTTLDEIPHVLSTLV